MTSQPDVELSVRFMRSDFRGVDASDAVRSIGGQTLKWWGLPYLNRDELRIHPEAWREVWRKTADVYVLSGMYTSLTFQVCILLLWLRGLPFVLWLERPAEASRNDVGLLMRGVRWPLFQLRNLVFRWMFFAASGVVAIGSLAARQYREKGAPADRVFSVPYCSDVSRFQSTVPGLRGDLRSKFGLQQKTVFLFSGQLVHRKGADLLMSAFAAVCRDRRDVALVLLGDGPERERLERMSAELPAGAVIFAGHRAQEELPGFFAMADVFVFPSRHDGWAVVVNEACAAGLPVLCSTETGAAWDLVEEQGNGQRIAPDDQEQWVSALSQLAADPELRTRFGDRSRQLSEMCSVTSGTRRMTDILREIIRRHRGAQAGSPTLDSIQSVGTESSNEVTAQ